jgi:hypothetical protein
VLWTVSQGVQTDDDGEVGDSATAGGEDNDSVWPDMGLWDDELMDDIVNVNFF